MWCTIIIISNWKLISVFQNIKNSTQKLKEVKVTNNNHMEVCVKNNIFIILFFI